jgi:hypothetical protein
MTFICEIAGGEDQWSLDHCGVLPGIPESRSHLMPRLASEENSPKVYLIILHF